MAERLHLPFLVLSDVDFKFCEATRLPTFEVHGMRLLKGVTMIIDNSIFVSVHYSAFPGDSDAAWVIERLSQKKVKDQHRNLIVSVMVE